MENIRVIRTNSPKQKPDEKALGFGAIFTDHMFVMDYDIEDGWHNPRVEPYGPFAVEPSMMVFHYGQAIFEGMKAYRNKNGDPVVFRPLNGIARLNRSAERLCIPQVDEKLVWQGLKTLLDIDKDWIPTAEGTALYIRPLIISMDCSLGVRPSHTYRFFIILSPVGAYYAEGIKPVKIYVTDEYVRAVKGGMGFAKTAGNYAASLYAAEKAKEKGYTQVLWLDGCQHKYVEEVGTMNIFFKIDDTLVTPTLEVGSILGGITRDSVVTMAEHMGYKVEERLISIDEVYEAHKQGRLKEVFGTGTAAVISPVGVMCWDDNVIEINNNEMGEFSKLIYNKITGIQRGTEEDIFGWVKNIYE